MLLFTQQLGYQRTEVAKQSIAIYPSIVTSCLDDRYCTLVST